MQKFHSRRGGGTSVSLPLMAGLGGKLAGAATFTRASVQWGVGDDGVYRQSSNDVPFFNSKGLLFEPASTNKCTCFGAIPADALGAELATNGSLSADTNWNKDAGWTITGGVGVATAAANNMYLNQATAFSVGKLYQFTYTVVSCSQGGFAAYFNGATGTTRTVPGTYTENLLATSSFYAAIKTVGTTTGSIDNISVKEVVMGVGTKSLYSGSFIQNLPNLTLSGDTAAILSIVDDTAALTAAGLLALCPSGKVYKLDNSAGAGAATVTIGGITAGTTPISISAYTHATGASFFGIGSSGGSMTPAATAPYSLSKLENRTATVTAGCYLSNNAGAVVYFILPQLEELPFSTSPMVTQGASASRAVTICQLPTSGNIDFTPGTLFIEAYPLGVGTATRLIHIDGSGRVYGNSAGSLNYYDGVLAPAGGGYSPLVTTKFALRYGNGVMRCANKGSFPLIEQAFDGTMGSGATISVGSDGTGATSFFGYIKNLKIYKTPASDAQLIAMTT